MSIEDYEAELDQLNSEIADVDNAMALFSFDEGGLAADMQAEFARVRHRLSKVRQKTLAQIETIRASTRH